MKPVMMSRPNEGDGDCLMACVASVLEVELSTLPNITVTRQDQWYTILSDALRPLGYRFVEFSNEPPVNPPGYAIAFGFSPRTDNPHACVALHGDVVHDPHPTGDGLAGITYWFLLIPFARSPQRTTPEPSDISL